MKALILTDLQNDFMEGGALPIVGAQQIVPKINQLQHVFGLIVATKDWHPADHQSFVDQHPGKRVGERLEIKGQRQTLWPTHCIQGSKGAQFVSELQTHKIARIFFTGVDREWDCYSGFGNGLQTDTGLYNYLKERRVSHVFVAGLATDYYVKSTAMNAAKLGFESYVVADACKAVNLFPGDEGRAYAQMIGAGVNIIRSEVLLAPSPSLH